MNVLRLDFATLERQQSRKGDDMDAIVNLIIGDIVEFNEMAVFTIICRLIVLGLTLETFGVVAGHLATAGRN